MYRSGEDFLDKIYADMRNSEIVNHSSLKSDKPEEKIRKYIDRLERIHQEANKHNKLSLLKKYYYDRYIIKELPESYISFQARAAQEEGHGRIIFTKQKRKEMLDDIQKNQQKSLDNWLDYFMSEDVIYPTWFKVYAFKGMLKLGKYDREKGEFVRRTESTVEFFLDFNREVLAKVYDTLKKYINKEELTDEEVKALNNGESFKKLYTYYMKCTNNTFKASGIDGVWIKYNQGDDYKPLWASLQGKNTGWCTAGEETAKKQVENGDFYVYYTKDENGEYKNPRIAIRMDGKYKIGEVRGISKEQNLEPEMIEIAEMKLNEFNDKDKYLKKVNDMKLLTLIEKKQNNNIELSIEELRFLYEIDSKIKGFGWQDDPRIKDIIRHRSIKKDLASIFNCKEENIAFDMDDFSNNKIMVYYSLYSGQDSFDYHEFCYRQGYDNKKLERLTYIVGNACFNDLESVRFLKSLKIISGNAQFFSLSSAEGLCNLVSIGGVADFHSLKKSNGLENLKYIGGNAFFPKLISANGLKNLISVGGHAFFENLKSAKGLNNLKTIGGHASFDVLESAEGLNSLFRIGEDACFNLLHDAQGLEKLSFIGGNANFDELINAIGLKSLKRINGTAFFQNLQNAEGLCNLVFIGDYANFEKLEKANGLNALICIGKEALFDSLIDSNGLDHLQSLNGYQILDISDLITHITSVKDKNYMR